VKANKIAFNSTTTEAVER